MKIFDDLCSKFGLINNDENNESIKEVIEPQELKPPEVQVRPAFEAVLRRPHRRRNIIPIKAARWSISMQRQSGEKMQ